MASSMSWVTVITVFFSRSITSMRQSDESQHLLLQFPLAQPSNLSMFPMRPESPRESAVASAYGHSSDRTPWPPSS